jgi:hypothetical protein
MKTEERIIKYIDGELTPDEKITFESEMKISPQLRKEYEVYLNIERRVKKSKAVQLNQNYLNTILSEFRNNRYRSKSVVPKIKIAYAFVILFAFIISFLLFKNIIWENSEINSVQKFAESLDDNQRIELLENLNGDLEDYNLLSGDEAGLDLANLLQSELKINDEIAEVYDISYTELVDELSTFEADKIYNEILNKNFSGKVNL